jgi:hypothetical protein
VWLDALLRESGEVEDTWLRRGVNDGMQLDDEEVLDQTIPFTFHFAL